MELLGQQLISADRQTVWSALNDPDVLVRCIPGCEEITRLSQNQLQVRLMVKMGPVRSRFAGTLTLENTVPPESCSLVFEGTGAAGFAKGGANVALAQQAEQTHLNYTAKASVGGKLGQIGGRLIESSARKMADEFFSAFESVLSGTDESAQGTAPTSSPATRSSQSSSTTATYKVDLGGRSPEAVQPDMVASRSATTSHAGPSHAAAATEAAAVPGGGWRPELYRAFWFCLGVFFTLLISHWLR